MNKVGDARVGFVGFPSVGKSTLLTKLTGTFSEVGAWVWQQLHFSLALQQTGISNQQRCSSMVWC